MPNTTQKCAAYNMAAQQEYFAVVQALARAQQNTSDTIMRLHQQLQQTRKAMQWWRTQALAHMPQTNAALQQTLLHSQQQAQQCRQQCLEQGQAFREQGTQEAPAWCNLHQSDCVLDDSDVLSAPTAPRG